MSGEMGSSRHRLPFTAVAKREGRMLGTDAELAPPALPGIATATGGGTEASAGKLGCAREREHREFGYKRREQVGVKLEKRGEFGWGRGWNTGARCGAGSPSAGERVTNAH